MQKNEIKNNSSMRLDKWLWSARFYKTRSIAQKQIELGRVQVNGQKVKNSKNISCGDTINLTLNSLPYKVTVLLLNHQRRPAKEAQLLYEEDIKVASLREQQKLLDQSNRSHFHYPEGRPTKRNRRQIESLKRGDW